MLKSSLRRSTEKSMEEENGGYRGTQEYGPEGAGEEGGPLESKLPGGGEGRDDQI